MDVSSKGRVLALLLMLVSAMTMRSQAGYSGYSGYGYGGYHGDGNPLERVPNEGEPYHVPQGRQPYYSDPFFRGHDKREHYNRRDTLHFARALLQTANKGLSVKERSQRLRDLKTEMDQRYDDVRDSQLNDLITNSSMQDGRLDVIRTRIKNMVHRLGDLEARLDRTTKISARSRERLATLRHQIDGFIIGSDIRQNALLSEINSTLDSTRDKLEAKLDDRMAATNDVISTLENDNDQFTELLNTTKCFQAVMAVDVNQTTKEGRGEEQYPPNFFANNSIPTVQCAIVGIVNRLGHDAEEIEAHACDDGEQRSAVSTHCQSLQSSAVVSVQDLSQGQGSRVLTLYVELRACSLAALS